MPYNNIQSICTQLPPSYDNTHWQKHINISTQRTQCLLHHLLLTRPANPTSTASFWTPHPPSPSTVAENSTSTFSFLPPYPVSPPRWPGPSAVRAARTIRRACQYALWTLPDRQTGGWTGWKTRLIHKTDPGARGPGGKETAGQSNRYNQAPHWTTTRMGRRFKATDATGGIVCDCYYDKTQRNITNVT